MKKNVFVKDIKLRGVSTNNLKSIDVSFPYGKITAVTGCSGSGKSSLVFHSLFAESERRYLESLSSFSRQYIKAQAKPKIKEAHHLLPAIAIKQARGFSNNRSTVGTLTEVGSLLELVFYHLSEIHCPGCNEIIKENKPEEIASLIEKQIASSASFFFLASLDHYKELKTTSLLHEIKQLGYSRLWSAQKKFFRLEEKNKINLDTDFLVVDRLSSEEADISRLLEACKQTLQIGRGRIFLLDDQDKITPFAQSRICFTCKQEFPEPSTSTFSFNSPIGACSECQGYGQSSVLDWKKIIPDENSSLKEKGIPALDFGTHKDYYNIISKNAKNMNISLSKAFSDYTKKEMSWLKSGDGKKFDGLTGYFNWLESKKYKPHYRMHLMRYKSYRTCTSCEGERYKKEALYFKIGENNISDVLNFHHTKLSSWLQSLKENYSKTNEELSSALEELESRLSYLEEIGLGYLNSKRISSSLSGGELQRIKMSRCLGNYLTQTLFCLDEPSSGLHPRDSEKLIRIICELKNQGNTVVMVEHEKSLIESCDHLIQIGPKSGSEGGEVTYAGPYKKEEAIKLKPNEEILENSQSFLEIKNASIHNLKKIHAKIPLGQLTGVCGVSGSGKTSLIKHTLYPLLLKNFSTIENETEPTGTLSFKGKKNIPEEVFFVSQDPITRTSRSTIATYLGIFDEIRKIFGTLPQAKALNLTNKHFSFNSPGGRCESCKGKGTIEEELSFLGSVSVICHVCSGKRFTEEVLSVSYKGYSILDILSCSIKELGKLFPSSKKIQTVLEHVSAVGLDYMNIGQELSSFSGGEAQRLKLLSMTVNTKKDTKAVLIFDEPTTGLSDQDVKTLLAHFQTLKKFGHTIIVVEHHTGLLSQCDWLLELGPEASEKGGDLIYEGPTIKLKNHKLSVTAPYIFS